MQVVVDGLLTHYELSGKGKLVLLLHGWADSSKGLAGLRVELAKHYQVLAVDLPGFGASQIPHASWGLDDYGQFLSALLTKLRLGQPYAVVGHSNGGAIAIRGIRQKVLIPQKLILLAAAGVRNKQKGKKLVLKAVAKAGKAATIALPSRTRERLRQSLYRTVGSDMLVVPQLEETYKRTVGQDVQKDAADITVPTLLIYATADEAVPLEYGQRYQELIKGSKLEVIEGASHFLHIEEPQRVEQLIEEFLK